MLEPDDELAAQLPAAAVLTRVRGDLAENLDDVVGRGASIQHYPYRRPYLPDLIHQTGDRLQHIRGALPCPVRVTAVTHPLCGRALEATSFIHRNGVLHLVVKLPDSSPGTIPASATDIFGDRQAGGPAVVLDAAGLRRLRALVEAVRAGSAAGRSR